MKQSVTFRNSTSSNGQKHERERPTHTVIQPADLYLSAKNRWTVGKQTSKPLFVENRDP